MLPEQVWDSPDDEVGWHVFWTAGRISHAVDVGPR